MLLRIKIYSGFFLKKGYMSISVFITNSVSYQKRHMIHPDSEVRWINESVGYGVVAVRFIPKGTITWVLDELDREFTPQELSAFSKPFQETLDKYCYRNSAGNFILCWDNARFVNHSFKSNCLSTPYDFEIAVRDIYPGEQLTDDYGYLNVHEPFHGLDEGTERRVVYPNDLLFYAQEWDALIKETFPLILSTPQALKHVLPRKKWNKIIRIINGNEKLRSIKSLYFNPDKPKRRKGANSSLKNVA
jgi:hypothetical protein